MRREPILKERNIQLEYLTKQYRLLHGMEVHAHDARALVKGSCDSLRKVIRSVSVRRMTRTTTTTTSIINLLHSAPITRVRNFHRPDWNKKTRNPANCLTPTSIIHKLALEGRIPKEDHTDGHTIFTSSTACPPGLDRFIKCSESPD